MMTFTYLGHLKAACLILLYVYLKKVFGKRIGFLYGWTLFLVVQTGCIAAISVAFAKFTGVLLPHLINDTPLLSFGVLNITPNAVGLRLFRAKKRLLKMAGGELDERI